ncbi:hypothetical protein PI125_g16558 [Phytophthora idaei]|nr:hypothetical protein PI125_g16558 [Phytophthora idaei]
MKVYASGISGGPTLLTSNGPPVVPQGFRPKPASSRHLRRPQRWTFGPFETAYKKLPWTTRQTIRSSVSLCAVLYVFFTFPFRIAFYYDPFSNGETITHGWTEELSIFAAMDAVADLIGIVEFLRFYNLQKKVFGPRFASFDVSKTNSLQQPSRMLMRSSSFNTPHHGKTKWTLASIGRSASLQGNTVDDTIYNRNFVRTKKIQLILEVVALLPVEVIPYASGAYNTLHLHLSSTGIDSLVKNIALCAGLCHYVACGYMLIAHAQCGVSLEACNEHVETSWAVRDRLFGASVARKYARTLYWASRTMVLLGYDDVTPVSDAETIYALVVTLMGALFGSSLLATFLFIFRFRNARYAAFSTHVDNAREYMRSQNIPRSVRRQVIAYFSYAWNTHHSLDSEEALHLMPRHLQSKVVSTLKASRIKQVCFLAKENVEFINLLAAALVQRVYSPADPIIEPKFNAQMFFVIRGTVALSSFNGSNSKECQTGNFFADSCLLSPETFEEKAVAKTFCELYVLAKSKFDEAMADFYRENEVEVRAGMAETLEKYTIQLRKTKKLLGARNRAASSRRAGNPNSITATNSSHSRRRGVDWRLAGSVFRIHWDAVRLLSIIFIAFEVPYFSVFISMTDEQHVFVEQPEFGLRYFITFLIEVLFGVDLVLRSRYFAHLDPIVMLPVEDPQLIFVAYKANGFYLDLIAWLPVGIILESLATASDQRFSWVFRLLRLLRLRKVPELLWSICDYYSVSSKAHLVISLILGVTFMLHVVGCVWFEMAWISEIAAVEHADKSVLEGLSRPDCLQHSTLFGNCSWVTFDCYAHIGDSFPAENPDSMYQASFAYMRSVYWAIVTLTAVGYGDIVAYSTAESFFAAFWVFVGGIINFGVVGAMSSTISNAMAPHHHHMEKLNTLNSILERMDISEKLSAEIRRFYHHAFTGRKQAYESQLLSHLPDQLCYEISSLLHSESVKSVALFDSASIEFLKEVTGKFRHRIYQNGDSICLEGDLCREFFVFLHGSKVNLFFRSRKVPIRALHEGDSYGVMAFLLKRGHPATLTAASLVHASVMTREQFDVIQRKFDDDLKDMKEEAETLWVEQQKNMRLIVRNLERLKLQPHMMSTSSLFYQGDTTTTTGVGAGKESKAVRDVNATREVLFGLWKTIIMCCNVYNTIFVIVRICFHSHLHFSSGTNTAVWVADLCCDICFALDIYLRIYYFGCPEVGLENLVQRKEIDKQYRRSSTLKWDVLASLPIYTPFASGSLIASLCRVPRLVRCVDLWTYLDDAIVLIQQHFASHNVSAYLSPVKLMIILVLMAHYVGCIFFWISEQECEHVEQCWMAHDHMLHQYHHSVPMLYAKSFYWAITTLLLVGSRESVPRDTAGTLWTSFTCLCCTFIIGHIVGEISELILELGKEVKQYKSRIASFDGFAKEHELSDGLRKRVGFFFREQFEHTKGTDLHHTVHDLSANLRLKLMLEIYGHSIMLLPIRRFLTSPQINNLALRLKSEIFIPGDNILVEGTFGSRLCTLRRGIAAAFWTSSVTSVAILMEGALFGEVAFFLAGQQRLATVRATTACEVLFVTKHDWQELWTSTGDTSDIQIQKHAQHALFNWVRVRLLRYERASLRAASKAKRLLSSRHTFHSTAAAAAGTAKARTKLSAVLLHHRESSDVGASTLSQLTPPQRNGSSQSLVDSRRTSVASEMQILERKTKYLQAKTDKCAKKFYPAIEALHTHRRASSIMSGKSIRSSISHSRSRGNSSGVSGVYRSMIGDTVTPIARNNSITTLDIRLVQFIVDTNPINKYVRDSLSDEHIREIEKECWTRFKLLAVAQFGVSRLLEELAPTEMIFSQSSSASGSADQRAPAKIQPARNNKLHRTRSLRYDENTKRKRSMDALVVAASNRRGSGPKAAKKWKALAVAAAPRLSSLFSEENVGGLRGRRFSIHAQETRHLPKTEQSARLSRMVRCHSLPHFGREFFDEMRRDDTTHLAVNNTQMGIDFETLQRCQRPQHSMQLRLFHRYRAWKDRKQATVLPEHLDHRHLNATIPRTSSTLVDRSASMGSRLQLASQQALQMARTDLKAKKFIKTVQQMGKTWDILMLLVALYHLIVTPFKVCFSPDLGELSDAALRGWSGFEIFMDLLCLVDVGYKLRHSSMVQENGASTQSSSRQPGIRRALASNPALRADIFAMLPLELLLFASDVRVPLAYESSIEEETRASWWTSRWILRMNRMLLASRIEPLTEQLFQFLIYDCKVQINEEVLYFIKRLSSYLTMGHLLACIWFITSYLGLHYYGASWLVTSGMLTYIEEVKHVEETERRLSEGASTFSLETVSLSRKYLRSLLFSMECISTLFYGDILSMNPLELVAEIAITLWAIYIYGALVGAQGELLDARAKREAAFEQILGELHHYLVQNEVPKGIKRQIKVYYARLWARRKGEAEFAAVAHVSRSLYEDVVLATLRGFAGEVAAFRALDDQFLRALLVCLHYVVCSEKEEVFVIGDMDRNMYFIAQGRVAVKMGSSESIRERGEFFGELALLYGISRLETCVAVTVTEMYRLDHEPYERLLLEFPEYRARNRLSWTTILTCSTRERSIIEEALRCFKQFGKSRTAGVQGPSSQILTLLNTETIAVNAERIDAQLPHSYIYRSAMELLSRLNKVDPLEAKDLYLKSRYGARRQLKTVLGIATARPEPEDDVVRSFHSSPATPRENSIHEHHSDSLEHMEAVVAELSRPTDHEWTENMKKALERSSEK